MTNVPDIPVLWDGHPSDVCDPVDQKKKRVALKSRGQINNLYWWTHIIMS